MEKTEIKYVMSHVLLKIAENWGHIVFEDVTQEHIFEIPMSLNENFWTARTTGHQMNKIT